ncbi:hypothetical protein BDV96DRAFT_578647 [Lophiotrema nucula]|uniref:Uncharacterized protein n=1 Tax=Lophiotrema nucula TaxID=690887 RepID=A0A6A5Z328_9PLEO|nr:hypothetical protein BDV96DRAFT_578647 [Lophiotrema nucula]
MHGSNDLTLDGIERKHSNHLQDPAQALSLPSHLQDHTSWACRLQSSWGPHWKCEELVQGILNDSHTEWEAFRALFGVCKKMQLDLVGMSVVDIVDLETLRYFLDKSVPPVTEQSTESHCLDAILEQPSEVHITLRLPLLTLKQLEEVAKYSPAVPSPTHLAVWPHLGSAITKLQNLKRLRIWLDHTEKSSWSLINERALLSLFLPPSRITGLDISVSLPRLNPRYESSEKHFTDDTLPPPFTVQRRQRQLYFAERSVEGQIHVSRSPDFPSAVLSEVAEFWELPKELVMQREREAWRRGIDLEAEMAAVFSNPEPEYINDDVMWAVLDRGKREDEE